MVKYIDRDQLIDWLKTEIKFKDLSDGLGICLVIMKEDFDRAIKHMPDSIIKDVVPVRHGRWIGAPLCGNDYCECSECGNWCNIHVNLCGKVIQKYCPYCGAKMD